MKTINLIFTSVAIALFTISSCGVSYEEDVIHGSWIVSEWKVEATNKVVGDKMDMEFKADSLYSIDYGPIKEEGKYWITGTFLHTHEEGETEKKVKIISIGADTMRIQMNRSGRLEDVVMIRK